MRTLSFGFIGLGLIAGSIAKGLREVYPDCRIIVYNRSANARMLAIEDGTANLATDCVDEKFSECDYIFLCTPVEHNITYLEQLKTLMKEDCILTDVGSVKGNIHKAIETLQMTKHFIGGHPMAGSEKTGYENSYPRLLENAYYALTPTDDTDKSRVEELVTIISKLNAIPVVIDYKTHDYAVAGISHVPHLIAATLVNLVKDNDSPDGIMKLLSAGGFKDITRIASSSPDMWQQICSSNKDSIVALLDKYIDSLTLTRNALLSDSKDYVYHMFEKSSEYRNSFIDQRRGPITKTYEIQVDIEDRLGTIRDVCTILAINHINLKNIGIVNNREHDGGVLRLEFNNEQDRENAVLFLKANGYTVYVK